MDALIAVAAWRLAGGGVLERLPMPSGIGMTRLESGGGSGYCGGRSGKVRVVRRRKRER